MKTVFIEDQKEINEIIKSCDLCNLGVIDTEGRPYVVPMNFGYLDGYIYLHGANFGLLIDSLKKNPEACITFCTDTVLAYQNVDVACSYRVKGKSVIVRGKIEFIHDFDQKVDALNSLMAQFTDKKFTYNSPAVKNVEVYRMKMDDFTAKEFGKYNEQKFPWMDKHHRPKSI